jgi:hypothetical protein
VADDAWAFEALGIAPDANWKDVERAYKRLISAHHPDRSGGDPERAAEITQAYRELRRIRDRKDELELADDDGEARAGQYRWLWAVPGALALMGVMIFAATGPLSQRPGERAVSRTAGPVASDLMDAPLSGQVIDQSIGEARRLALHDEMALAAASRDCHHQLRVSPTLTQLDRCAAFDDAVVQLQDRDPLRDQGPFSEIAVASRQISAASMLSDDSLAIDGRLDRIRLHVELALAPTTVEGN